MTPIATRLTLLSLASLMIVSISAGQDRAVADGSLVEWPTFEEALAAASKSGRIVLIDVFSPTCPWCRKMQHELYTDKKLQQYLYDTFELGRIDITINTDTVSFKEYKLSSAELGAGLGATGTPTTIFLESTGDYITRLPGFHALDEFFDVLKFVGSKSFRKMSFEEFLEEKK